MSRARAWSGMDVRCFHLGGGGYYEDVLRQSGVPVDRIFSPNQPWVMLASVTRTLCRLRPQIVLAAQFGDLLYGAAAGRCCNAMVLGGVRSDGIYELNAHGRLGRWMARLAHGLVANSYRARQNLVGRRISSQKIEVLPNVIDLRDFDERSVLPAGVFLPSARVIVAVVGSLHPCKRLERVLEALAGAGGPEQRRARDFAGPGCEGRAGMHATDKCR